MSAKENADYLMQIATKNGIKDPKELGNFMGQMQVECGGFSHMSENLHYSGERLLEMFPGRNGLHTIEQANAIAADGPEAVASAIYGGAWGKAPGHLGNTEPGDGWKFHGRGYVQLTGRANYEHIGKEMGLDLVNHPELAENREIAAKIAVHYWESRVVSNGDQKNVSGACYGINGGYNGLADRKAASSEWETKLGHGYTPSAVAADAMLTRPASSEHSNARTATHDLRGARSETGSTLEQGAYGPAVHDLQSHLAKLGYKDGHGHPLQADGDFGIDTRHAVERFQHDHHLTVDGIAGTKTLHALQQAQAKQATPNLTDPTNPDHALYEQARMAVYQLDASMGRTPDKQSDQLAASLVVAAKREGLNSIDSVVLGEDGSRAFAMQGRLDAPLRKFAHVQTAEAVNTSLMTSSAAAAEAMPRQPVPMQQPTVQAAPAPAMAL